MLLAKPAPTPMPPPLSENSGDLLKDDLEYRSMLGALQYLLLTLPDISYTAKHVSFCMHPGRSLKGRQEDFAVFKWNFKFEP